MATNGYSRSLTYDEIRMWLQLFMFIMMTIFFFSWIRDKTNGKQYP